MIHRRGPWKTNEAVELTTLAWVAWFNHHRLMEPIGYIAPAGAEENYWRQRQQPEGLRRPLRGLEGRRVQEPKTADHGSLITPTDLHESGAVQLAHSSCSDAP